MLRTRNAFLYGLARLFVQDMIFQVPQLIVEITKIFTLEAGDLILTGTPEGVGPIQVDPQLSEGFFRGLFEAFLMQKKLNKISSTGWRSDSETHFFELDLWATPFCRKLHKILSGERERERAENSHIWYMCFLKDVHVFSFTRRDWFDHGSPIPTFFFCFIWAWQS